MFMRTVVRWVVSPGYSERSPSERSKQKIKILVSDFGKRGKKKMLVLAMSKKDSEYLYIANTACKVSKASAKTICEILNKCQFAYSKYPGSVWYIHEVDKYDTAFDYAQYQKFTIRKGIVKYIEC